MVWKSLLLGHSFFAVSAEALVALALAGSIAAVHVTGSRNGELRRELVAKSDTATEARYLTITLRRNVELSALEGAKLPEPVAGRVRAIARPGSNPGAAQFLVMVYTPMVCQRALHDGLQTLVSSPIVKAKEAATFVVVGVNGPADRERALLYRADGTLPFPVAFVPADTLVHALFAQTDDTFDEEPIYLMVDRQLHVRSAFHADQRRPELLDLWLERSNDATQ